MTTRIGGTTTVFVDGEAHPFKADGSVMPQNSIREMVDTEGGRQGWTEMPTSPTMELTLTYNGNDGFNPLSLADKTGIVITAQLANGKNVTLKDAVVVGEIDHSWKENEVKIKFAGSEVLYT